MLESQAKSHRFSPVDEVSDRISEKVELHSAAMRPRPRPNRVQTRFLNFSFGEETRAAEQVTEAPCLDRPEDQFAYGRLSIVDGAGSGTSFALTQDFARIGRGDDQEVQLAFGDTSVSREGHAVIIYYGERHGFVIRDGRKANPVLLNHRALRGEEHLHNGDMIRIGETTLHFTTRWKN